MIDFNNQKQLIVFVVLAALVFIYFLCDFITICKRKRGAGFFSVVFFILGFVLMLASLALSLMALIMRFTPDDMAVLPFLLDGKVYVYLFGLEFSIPYIAEYVLMMYEYIVLEAGVYALFVLTFLALFIIPAKWRKKKNKSDGVGYHTVATDGALEPEDRAVMPAEDEYSYADYDQPEQAAETDEETAEEEVTEQVEEVEEETELTEANEPEVEEETEAETDAETEELPETEEETTEEAEEVEDEVEEEVVETGEEVEEAEPIEAEPEQPVDDEPTAADVIDNTVFDIADEDEEEPVAEEPADAPVEPEKEDADATDAAEENETDDFDFDKVIANIIASADDKPAPIASEEKKETKPEVKSEPEQLSILDMMKDAPIVEADIEKEPEEKVEQPNELLEDVIMPEMKKEEKVLDFGNIHFAPRPQYKPERRAPRRPAPAAPAPVAEQPAPVAPVPVVEQPAPAAPAPVVEQPAPAPVVEQPAPAPVAPASAQPESRILARRRMVRSRAAEAFNDYINSKSAEEQEKLKGSLDQIYVDKK